MGWMALCMGCKKFPSEGNRENALSFSPAQRTALEKLCHLEKRAWGETILRNEPRWMRGVFVGKLDRTDEFLLLTPTGAMKTRCVRDVWKVIMLAICNFCICVLAVRGMRQQGARSRNQQSNKRMSWKAADVRKECTCDRTCWTSTDVLQDAHVVLALGSTQRSAE